MPVPAHLQSRPLRRRGASRQPRYGRYIIVFLAIFIGWRLYGVARHRDQQDASVEPQHVFANVTEERQLRVGIQVGHWKNEDLPDELEKLRWYSTGTTSGGATEWEVAYSVARTVATKLMDEGIAVDILPATVPERYEADAFISLHADGNEDTTVSGYKVAGSAWDPESRAAALAERIDEAYATATYLEADPNITDDMTEYYAFNYGKFTHAIAPTTPGAIVELGFLTNSHDRQLLVRTPQKAAAGITEGILEYLRSLPDR